MANISQLLHTHPSEVVQTIRGMPMIKDPLSFFQMKQDSRIFVTITDSPSVWQNDLIIAERLFAEIVVCPFQIDATIQTDTMTVTRDVLKQRMRYPNVKDDSVLETIAKTWVLPAKVHDGPCAEEFLHTDEGAIFTSMNPIFKALNKEDSPVIHMLKLELTKGVERQMIYKFLDSGFRPSILLIKWSYDIDEHVATAHCAGHVMNSGYSLFAYENGYALYIFTDQTLYDTCSLKTIGYTNPILASIVSGIQVPTQVPVVSSSQIQTTEPSPSPSTTSTPL